MCQKRESLLFTISILLASCWCFADKVKSTRFLAKPNKIEYGEEGSDFKMEWDFQIESRPPYGAEIKGFNFGLWGVQGHVKYKILYMDDQPRRVRKRPGYETKVDWNGNITKCTNCLAVVTLRNLSLTDFTKYGVDFFLGSHRNALNHWFELRDPPRIVNWLPKREVQEGNTTTITCTAEGIPTPFVRLQKNNETLCNHTKYCDYIIPLANSAHEGEYECFAQQSKKSVKKTLRLRVVSKDGSQRTPETTALAASLPLIMMFIGWG